MLCFTILIYYNTLLSITVRDFTIAESECFCVQTKSEMC